MYWYEIGEAQKRHHHSGCGYHSLWRRRFWWRGRICSSYQYNTHAASAAFLIVQSSQSPGFCFRRSQ